MDRLNSEALPRHKLLFALRDETTVRMARRINRCILCRRADTNEAGLCPVCWSLLTDEELAAASRWTIGVAP